ncbi:thymidylate kinase-domain-containing protein [Xylariaceae sp. FL1019]|nr:thymidylate kinase-domain-containing protein [Xylariaceae sp. FL1019]
MASINDLATAATIASTTAAMNHSSPESSVLDPNTPGAPSPSAQLEEQAREVHEQQNQPANRTLSEGPASPGSEARSIHVKAGEERTATQSPAPAAEPVLAGPQISPPTPAQATIPARVSPGRASGGGDGMDGVEYEDEKDGAKGPPVRGALVIFEGMDRAGKTTQAKLLQLRCIESGREVKFMRFPDRTTVIGRMIDSYLKGESGVEDHVIHLLFTANRWEAAETIKAELAAGHIVICDRYYHSGIVYSAAKQLPSLSLSWAKAPEVGLPRPDIVLFLDLDESVARSRGGWGGEIYEKGEMQRRVRELFWGLSMGDLGTAVKSSKPPSSSRSERTSFGNGANSSSARDRERTGLGAENEEEGEFRQEEEDIQIVDADLGVEELSDKVWDVVLPRLLAVERGEVGKSVRIVR